jgi:hypothetical protein
MMELPFPGMDPYLELPALWPDVHARLISTMCDALQEQLGPNYIALITPYIALENIEIAPARQVFVPDVGIMRDDAADCWRRHHRHHPRPAHHPGADQRPDPLCPD